MILSVSALENFIRCSGLQREVELALPDSPFAEVDNDKQEFYFLLQNLKRVGFNEEFDKQVLWHYLHVRFGCAIGRKSAISEKIKDTIKRTITALLKSYLTCLD